MRTAHRLLMAWMAFLLLIQGGIGVFIFCLGLSDQQRLRVSQWIMDSSTQMFFIGGLLTLLAILLVAVTIRFDRKEYYQVKMGFFGLATEVDLDVVRSLVGRYWQTHFPSVNPQIDALLRSDQTLELFVELPKVSSEERTEVMQRIESDLGRQFARHLGYRRPFLITVYS
jgi:hypothetical protein